MSFEQQTARIERLVWLIERSNTGTAEELAKKLSVSRRTIFNDLEFLKGKGYEIIYCHADSTYRCEKKRNNHLLF
jgi:DeoR/GlpR family transcriptional regulator of sugar metabolism